MKRLVLTLAFSLGIFSMMAVPPMPKNAPKASRNEKVVPPPPHSAPIHVAPSMGPRCASPEQVANIVRVLKEQSFESQRLNVAQLCVTLCPISTEGLREIAQTFSFDDNRLAFLEYAYDYCPDADRYLQMRELFSFKSYQDRLVDFVIKRQK